MELKTGSIYLINHCRKGTFAMKVLSQCDEWTDGVIIGGVADAILEYNEKQAGDKISIRTSFIETAIEQITP